jgi:hypothetical protein
LIIESRRGAVSHHEPWKELYRYWLTQRVDGRPPGRDHIDPLIDIPRLAGNLIIIDVLPDGFQYRLMGTVAARHFGIDLTGRYVGTGISTSAITAAWVEAVEHVAVTCEPKLLVSQFPKGIKVRNVVLLLPLGQRDGRAEQILAGSFSDHEYEDHMRISAMTDAGPRFPRPHESAARAV